VFNISQQALKKEIFCEDFVTIMSGQGSTGTEERILL